MTSSTLSWGREEWWSSKGGEGWATYIVVALLLSLYSMRTFVRFLIHSLAQKSLAKGSISRTNGYGIDMAGPSLPTVTEADLKKLLLLLNGDEQADACPWTPVVEKHSETLSYYAQLREPGDGSPTEYLSTTLFRNCSGKKLKDFYMDNDYRLQWDKTFESYELLQADDEVEVELGHFIRRFPFMRPRQYVLAWRIWEGEDGSFYYFAKHYEHPQTPRVPMYTRVEHYLSGWRISREGNHCEIKMWHQEDTTSMTKMAFSYRIWPYMCDMERSLRKYQGAPSNGTRTTPTRVPKVPAELLKSFPPAEHSGNVHTKPSSSDYMKRKLSMRRSGRWMANGMLVLGGAMFLTRQPAPLGVKIAALYAIRKLVKPSASVRPIRQHYPVLHGSLA